MSDDYVRWAKRFTAPTKDTTHKELLDEATRWSSSIRGAKVINHEDHIGMGGLCNCDCDKCSLPDGTCICPACNKKLCGLHDTNEAGK